MRELWEFANTCARFVRVCTLWDCNSWFELAARNTRLSMKLVLALFFKLVSWINPALLPLRAQQICTASFCTYSCPLFMNDMAQQHWLEAWMGMKESHLHVMQNGLPGNCTLLERSRPIQGLPREARCRSYSRLAADDRPPAHTADNNDDDWFRQCRVLRALPSPPPTNMKGG